MPNKALLAQRYVLQDSLFTVRRRVRWAECDPAGVVFAGNYPLYLTSTVDWFKRRAISGLAATTMSGLNAPTRRRPRR